MDFLIIIIFAMVVIGFGLWFCDINPLDYLPHNKKIAAAVKNRSWAANQIKAAYDTIPVNSRPDVDIDYVLTALDTKYEIEQINYHFSDFPRCNWNCACMRYGNRNSERCPYREYHLMYNEMKGISDDLKAQEHALALASVSDGLSQAEELMNRLRDERKLIQSVTKELANEK